MVIFCFFATHFSAEAYLCMLPPQGHSTVGVPKRCGGFVAIWLCSLKEFSDNRFQLFVIYIDVAMIPPFAQVAASDKHHTCK